MRNLHKLLRQKLGRSLTEEEMEEFREVVRKDNEEGEIQFPNAIDLMKAVNEDNKKQEILDEMEELRDKIANDESNIISKIARFSAINDVKQIINKHL